MNPIHLRELPKEIPQQPLTVGDLIQLLSRVDPNLPVLIEDYESGVTTMFRISQSEIVRDPVLPKAPAIGLKRLWIPIPCLVSQVNT